MLAVPRQRLSAGLGGGARDPSPSPAAASASAAATNARCCVVEDEGRHGGQRCWDAVVGKRGRGQQKPPSRSWQERTFFATINGAARGPGAHDRMPVGAGPRWPQVLSRVGAGGRCGAKAKGDPHAHAREGEKCAGSDHGARGCGTTGKGAGKKSPRHRPPRSSQLPPPLTLLVPCTVFTRGPSAGDLSTFPVEGVSWTHD
eukprot:350415-Chlamydomonas_euryale.AAC.5